MTLHVSAVGPGHISYKWKKDKNDFTDSKCTGTNKSTLTIPSFGYRHQGVYTCEVKDDLHQEPVESRPANLKLSKEIVTIIAMFKVSHLFNVTYQSTCIQCVLYCVPVSCHCPVVQLVASLYKQVNTPQV